MHPVTGAPYMLFVGQTPAREKGKGRRWLAPGEMAWTSNALRVVLFQRHYLYNHSAVMGDWLYHLPRSAALAWLIALELAWPMLRPLCEVLYEELLAQHRQAQAQRADGTAQDLLALFPGLQNSAYNLSTPPCSRRLRPKSQRRSRRSLRPYATSKPVETQSLTIRSHPACEDTYEVVRTVSLTLRDFRDWSLQDCQAWRRTCWGCLPRGGLPHYGMPCNTFCMSVPGRSGTPACLKPRMIWRLRWSTPPAAGPVPAGPRRPRGHASVWRLCSALTQSIARLACNPT